MTNIVIALLLLLSPVSLSAFDPASSVEQAQAKLQLDTKTAVLDGAITVPQLRELQASVDKLKAFHRAHQPGATVDLLTPFHATSDIKRVFDNTGAGHREQLQGDFQALLMAQTAQTAASNPNPTAAERLGKDIFKAVVFDSPSERQFEELQDSLNALKQLKRNHSRPLQALMKFRQSKSEIAAVMSSPVFAPDSRQRVQADLDDLRPQS